MAWVMCVSLMFTGLSGCKEEVKGGEAVKSEVYVLVDLSETWLNPSEIERNRRLLTAIGQGAGLVAPTVPQPYLIQYRVIGNNSYFRPPICSAVFMPGFRRDKDRERQTREPALRTYLTRTCVEKILLSPPEPLTQISAAIASIAAEPRPSRGGTRRVIIASDFLEETADVAPVPTGSLAGVSVLLLYRPLTRDQLSPAGTRQRVDERKAFLEARGAHVETQPDTSIRASQIVSFLQS
jgi:hypothetical protein